LSAMRHLVVGGGVSGLSAAYYLSQLPSTSRVTLLESSHRLGGWIDTTRHADGLITEAGARTLRPAGPAGANTLCLADQLGLVDKIRPVLYGHPASTNRLVLAGGTLHTLPNSLASVVRFLPPFEKPLFLAGVKDLIVPVRKCEDVNLFEFVARRFGEDVAQYAVDPLVRGICAGDAKEISVNFIAKYLFEKEQNDGGVLKGWAKDTVRGFFKDKETTEEESTDIVRRARKEKWSVWSLQGGLTTLVEALEKKLVDSGVEIVKEERVESIEFGDGATVVTRHKLYDTDTVICSSPAYAAAKMLSKHPFISSTLSSIPFVSVAVVQLIYDTSVLDMEAFGFLVPSNQPEPILGCIFDTCTFPQGDKTVLTVMMGGAWYGSVVGGKSREEVGAVATETVTGLLGIREAPRSVIVKIQEDCIAQYTVGHLARVRSARADIAREKWPLRLVGSSYDGVGINDSIMSAKNAALSL